MSLPTSKLPDADGAGGPKASADRTPPADPRVPAGPPGDASPDPLLGALVAAKSRVGRLVARGGMGRIYLAEQQPLGRSVALKVLDTRYIQRDQDPEFQKRFLLEASTCARLTHPNTVKVFDYGRLDADGQDTYFMVMEFVEGRTLRQAIKQQGQLPPARALRVTREICRSLREAHRLGIVHRDLKPSNVMLVASDEGESVKVLDFGIVKVMRDDDGDLTVSGRFLGSPRYMSPEIIRHSNVDGRSDIYALGILLYEMLCGRAPFQGEKSVHTMMSHINDPVPTLMERGGLEIAGPVEALVRRCLEKDPKDRFQTVDELMAGIEALSYTLALDIGVTHRPSVSFTPGAAASEVTTGSFPSAPSAGGTPMAWSRSADGAASNTRPNRAPRRVGLRLAVGAVVLGSMLVYVLLRAGNPATLPGEGSDEEPVVIAQPVAPASEPREAATFVDAPASAAPIAPSQAAAAPPTAAPGSRAPVRPRPPTPVTRPAPSTDLEIRTVR